jgi:hypothetical protein
LQEAGEEGIKENGGGGEFKCEIFGITVRTFVNLCKCHKFKCTVSTTTIIKK